MNDEQFQALLEQAKALVAAVQAAAPTTPQVPADVFTQAEADKVKDAVQALVTPEA